MSEKSSFSIAKEKIQTILSIVNLFLMHEIVVENFIQILIDEIFCSYKQILPLGNNVTILIYSLLDPCGLFLNTNVLPKMSESDLRINIEKTKIEIECALKLVPGYWMSYVIFDSHREFILKNLPNGIELLNGNMEDLFKALSDLIDEHGFSEQHYLNNYGIILDDMMDTIFSLNW